MANCAIIDDAGIVASIARRKGSVEPMQAKCAIPRHTRWRIRSLVNMVGHAMVYENVSLLVEYSPHDQEVGGIPDSGFPRTIQKRGDVVFRIHPFD